MSKYNRVWTVEAEQVTKEKLAAIGTILRDRHGNPVVPQIGDWIVTHADLGFEIIKDALFQVNYMPVVDHHEDSILGTFTPSN